MPQAVRDLGPLKMELTLDTYISFWKKAKKDTSCYPSELSFSTMKAGAHDRSIAALDCSMTRIPLKHGFAPKRWKLCLDVMLLKKSGVTDLSALRTIVLFPVDCNYAFKHVGRSMMAVAEQTNALAPEQYGSRKQHKAIDLAVNKALTFDILRQLKRAGAICSTDAKSCYDLIGHTQASLSMQRVGVPKNIINCLFTALQEAVSLVRHPNCLQAPPSVPRIIHLRRQQAAIAQHPVPVPLATLALQVTSHLQAITCHLVMPHPAKTIPLATPAQPVFNTVQLTSLPPAMGLARMTHQLPTQSHSRFPR